MACSALTAILLVCPLVVLADEDAEKAFEMLYGADYKRVTETKRDKADDLALATKFVAAAKAKDTHPGLAAILCDKAYELASQSPSGYDTAVEAMEMLADRVPEKEVACWEKAIDIRERQYRMAKGLDQAQTGEQLIDALLLTAAVKGENGAATGASTLCQRAMLVAKAVKSDRKNEIQARLEQYSIRQRYEKEAATLKTQVEANPKDAALRQKLLRLLLVELDDPAQAAAYLDDSSDEEMRKCLPAVAKGVDAAPELACMELGDWYWKLSEGASASGKGPMLVRAQDYYKRYLTLHKQEDLSRSQATLAVKKAEESLAKLGSVKGSGIIWPGRWVELLQHIDPKKDRTIMHDTNARWALKDGFLTGDWGNAGSIAVPCAIDGSFQVKIVFVRTRESKWVAVSFPVGKTTVAVWLSENGGGESKISQIRDSQPVRVLPGTLTNAQDYTLDIKVTVAQDQVDIAVLLDGKDYLHWRGPQSALSVGNKFLEPATPKSMTLGIGGGAFTFKSVKLRMLTGQAKLLR